MNDPVYAIKASWSNGQDLFMGYAIVDPDIDFTTKKTEAALFKSKVLAYGWMLKMKALYITYTFDVVNL